MPRSRRGHRSFNPFRRWIARPAAARHRPALRPPAQPEQQRSVLFASSKILSKKVSKIQRETKALPRIECSGVSVEGKLQTSLDADIPVNAQHARTEE